MIEREKIIIVSYPEFIYIKNMFNKKYPITQSDIYYDNECYDLNKLGITCRIREFENKFTLTIKEHQNNWGDISIENTKIINSLSGDEYFTNMGLKRQGRLITIRYSFYPYNGINLCLDNNIYLGESDYVLEIKYNEGMEDLAYHELKSISYLLFFNHISFQTNSLILRIENPVCKSKRFFDRKRDLI